MDVRKRKKGIETANRILEVSAELFARQGYDNVPVRLIAQAAGIKESSLYNHFKGKMDILSALFLIFREQAPLLRPLDSDLDKMLLIMQPEEVMKNILFYFGSHVSSLLENIAMVINNEKYRNPLAAEVYFQCIVNEPSDYYERLFQKMIDRGTLGQVDARMFAEQYNYVSVALTKEYFMVKNDLADMETVIRYMIKTIHFFCGLMKAESPRI